MFCCYNSHEVCVMAIYKVCNKYVPYYMDMQVQVFTNSYRNAIRTYKSPSTIQTCKLIEMGRMSR
jgi:hypothetical protein